MEIKETEEIVKESATTNFKDTFIWKNVDIYKRWVAIDDLFKFIKGYESFVHDLPKELGELKKELSNSRPSGADNSDSSETFKDIKT